MSLAARTLLKEEHTPKVFEELPEVLIQDPLAVCAYHVPAEELAKFRAGADVWAKVGPGTVTFVLPSGDMIEEVPPFRQVAEEAPSVLIQFPRGEASYFLTAEDLLEYRIPQPQEYWEGFTGVSFVIPRSTELIEQLPALRRAALQSST